MNDVTVIVRSVNERTTSSCRQLLLEVFQQDSIFIINEVPFSNAIRKSFEIGIIENKKWTLCIDADVLVYAKSIRALVDFGEKMEENVFEVQGLVEDKFFFVKRPAGNHLYRTTLIPIAKELIPSSNQSLRPETDMLNKMVLNGFSWRQTDLIIGLHDFEQFYSDIFRKNVLQAHKHSSFLYDIIKKWESLKEKDFDYQVALWGVRWGTLYNSISVDKKFQEKEILEILNIKRVEEKNSCKDIDILAVKDEFKEYEDKNLQKLIFPNNRWNEIHLKSIDVAKYRKERIKPSLIGDFIARFGYLIEKIGHKIKLAGKNLNRRNKW